MARVANAALLLVLVVSGASCEPECFDVHDCLADVPEGHRAACEVGSCVFHALPGVDEPDAAGGPEPEPEPEPEPDAGADEDAGMAPADSGVERDAGADAGAPDAGAPDAGAPDAGRPDAGRPDAGRPDAGVPDAGRPDGGGVDAGPDAGGPTAFVVVLYPSVQLAPLADGGGLRGGGTATVSWNGEWQLNFSLGHDAGSWVIAAELRNGIAPRVGVLVASLDGGPSPVVGSTPLSPAMLKEVQGGRAYFALPSADEPEGHLRGQLLLPGEVLTASELWPVPGFAHPGSGGSQLLISASTLTARYEASWTDDVVATAAHIHALDGGVLTSLALLPDAGGARGVLSLFSLVSCQAQPCRTDVHTRDGGVAGAPAGAGNVLLQTP